MLRFSVENTGIGIPAAQQEHLFDKFTQADTSTTRHYGGTGLDLAISKQLVDLMGGTIGVISRPGEGSHFWFTLGLLLDDQPCTEPIPRVDLKDKRALIVDDNETNCRVLGEQLKNWEMQVDCCRTGEEALSELRRAESVDAPYHIVLLDHQMPGMDGDVLARIIKADPNFSDLVLIMLSSSGQRLDENTMAASGLEIQLKKIRSPIDRIRPKPVERHCMGYQKKTFLLTFDNLLLNLYLCPHH